MGKRDVAGASRRVARSRRAEEVPELRGYGRPMRGELGIEGCGSGGAHRQRERVALPGVGRQRLRLPVVAVLQAVLELAQIQVSVPQRADRRGGEESSIGGDGEGRQGPARPQSRLAAAANELQRLDDELDFANAAWPELDVLRVVVAPALLADLAVNVAQTVVSIEVEVLAVDERRDERVELVVPPAGHGARLEPRVALPGAPLRDEVLLEGRIGHRERPARAVRA